MTAPVDRKRLSTLCARAALAGITLRHLEGDYGSNLFIVSKWALTRQFLTIDALQEWLDLVTSVEAERPSRRVEHQLGAEPVDWLNIPRYRAPESQGFSTIGLR